MTFLERLAALVPPPRAHLVVYHGILASAAAVRSDVIPYSFAEASSPSGRSAAPDSETAAISNGLPATVPAPRSRNYTWAELMKRVFLIDVLRCPCGGTRRLIASITEAAVIMRILRCLGLAAGSSERASPEVTAITSPDHPRSDFREIRLVIE
jgi:hypothetical protein